MATHVFRLKSSNWSHRTNRLNKILQLTYSGDPSIPDNFHTAWNAAEATDVDNIYYTWYIGAHCPSPGYSQPYSWDVSRLALVVYTPNTLLLQGAPIVGWGFRLYSSFKYGYTSGVMVIQKGDDTHPHNTVIEEDYDQSYYSGNYGEITYAQRSSFIDVDMPVDLLNSDGSPLRLMIRSQDDIDEVEPSRGTERGAIIYLNDWVGEPWETNPHLYIEITVTIPIVQTDDATNVTSESATINGTITDNGNYLGAQGFEYKKGAEGDVTSVEVSRYGTFKKDLTGLDTGATYYYRAWGENEAGKGYGDWVEFTTESTVTVTTQDPTLTDDLGFPYYKCAMGNGTIVSGSNITQRGFEVKVAVDYFGVGGDIWWGLIGFNDTGLIVYHDYGQRTGYLVKIEYDHGTPYDPELGAYVVPLGKSGVFAGECDYAFNDALEECTSYTYRAYIIVDEVTYYGEYVAFDMPCYPEYHCKDDISDGDPCVPIIPILPILPIDIEEPIFPDFEWEPEDPMWDIPDLPDLPNLPPWYLPDLPEWEWPDYPVASFVGDFYYRKPYTKKDLDYLRKKCIIYNKNSVEFALVLRHNMNVLREFFNMMTDYMSKDEFNDFTDRIPPQRLKELSLDPLEPTDFRDMINGFIRNTVDNNIAVNRNFNLIQEGLSDYETGSDDAHFRNIVSNMKQLRQDNPDVERMKTLIDNLNYEVAMNFNNIMHNLSVVRARLL